MPHRITSSTSPSNCFISASSVFPIFPHSFDFVYTGQSGTDRNTNVAKRGKHEVLSSQTSTRLLSVAKI